MRKNSQVSASTGGGETNKLHFKNLFLSASDDIDTQKHVIITSLETCMCVCGDENFIHILFFGDLQLYNTSMVTLVPLTRAELSVIFTTQVFLRDSYWLSKNPHHYFCTVHCCIYQAFLPSHNCRRSPYGSADGWPLSSAPMYSPLMLLYSILSCVERCGLIAHSAKLVFLHLGERSEPGANVAPRGSLNGITMADRLRLSYFNEIVQGVSQETLLNAATCDIFKLKVYVYLFNPYKKIQLQYYHSTGPSVKVLLSLRNLCFSGSVVLPLCEACLKEIFNFSDRLTRLGLQLTIIFIID